MFPTQLAQLLPQRQIMLIAMKTFLKPTNLFLAAASAVDRQIDLGISVVEVRPLVDELAIHVCRHQPQELGAAIITATALRGAGMRWQAEEGAALGGRPSSVDVPCHKLSS